VNFCSKRSFCSALIFRAWSPVAWLVAAADSSVRCWRRFCCSRSRPKGAIRFSRVADLLVYSGFVLPPCPVPARAGVNLPPGLPSHAVRFRSDRLAHRSSVPAPLQSLGRVSLGSHWKGGSLFISSCASLFAVGLSPDLVFLPTEVFIWRSFFPH
jgi:hypothetical protein